jgi:hypothetical protein
MTTDTNKPQLPKRHWCFTAWFILVILATFWAAFTRPVLVFYCVANLILIGALYKWRRWGFWGFLVMAAVMFFVQLSDGVGILRSAFVFVGVAILYGVLQIGGDKKAWNYLR